MSTGDWWRWLALTWFVLAGKVACAALPEAVHTHWQADITPGIVSPDKVDGASWRRINLDHAWRRVGACDHTRWTYRLAFEVEAPLGEDQGVWIHRAGNRLRLWANEYELAEFGQLDNDRADYSNGSLYARIPWHVLRPGENVLLVQVAGDCRRYSGLSHLDIGAHRLLEPQWQRTEQMENWLTAAIVSVSVLVSLASLGFYAMNRHRKALLLGVASGAWALREWLWSMTELPMPFDVWFFLLDLTFAIWMPIICILTLRLSGVRSRRLEMLQWVGLAVAVVTSAAATAGAPIFVKGLGLQLLVVVGCVTVWAVLRQAIRDPNGANLTLLAAAVSMLALGLMDHWNVWLSPAPDAYQRFYYTPLIAVLFIFAIGALLMRQFDLAMRTVAHYRESLEQEVTRQREQLRAQHEREQLYVRREAIEQERRRIAQDMHDGLGAQLVGLLSSVRTSGGQAAVLEQEVQHALVQLRATMDSLSSEAGDLSTALAQFRYLHEARLCRMGLRLDWQVQLLPDLVWGPRALTQLDFWLREAFANVIKHAQATCVTVQAWQRNGQCELAVTDNGCGYDPTQPTTGRGRLHLVERAAALGMQLQTVSRPGQGTTVRLVWPVSHVVAD